MSYNHTLALYEAMLDARLTFNTLEVMFQQVEDEQYENGESEAEEIAKQVTN